MKYAFGRQPKDGELNPNYRHGAAVGGPTREYWVYAAAKDRCTNPRSKDYSNYGGRGIRFEFESFSDFISHIGPRPAGLLLDRINNDGNYCLGNVRWATRLQQNNNRRKRRGRLTK